MLPIILRDLQGIHTLPLGLAHEFHPAPINHHNQLLVYSPTLYLLRIYYVQGTIEGKK